MLNSMVILDERILDKKFIAFADQKTPTRYAMGCVYIVQDAKGTTAYATDGKSMIRMPWCDKSEDGKTRKYYIKVAHMAVIEKYIKANQVNRNDRAEIHIEENEEGKPFLTSYICGIRGCMNIEIAREEDKDAGIAGSSPDDENYHWPDVNKIFPDMSIPCRETWYRRVFDANQIVKTCNLTIARTKPQELPGTMRIRLPYGINKPAVFELDHGVEVLTMPMNQDDECYVPDKLDGEALAHYKHRRYAVVCEMNAVIQYMKHLADTEINDECAPGFNEAIKQLEHFRNNEQICLSDIPKDEENND